jgi:hypothetical protein
MLSAYQISNQGVQIKEVGDMLSKLETPFIAHIGNEFVIVTAVKADEIVYTWRNKAAKIATAEFLKIWSGITLLVEVNESAIEPDYYKHRREELIMPAKKIGLALTVFVILGVSGYSAGTFVRIDLILVLLINVLGAYIAYLLMLKQLHIQSHLGNQLCSLFSKQNDCNRILESKASKLLDVFSWSEIGLGYFVANILLIIFAPTLYPYLSIINMLALPNTLWSVWYQKFKARQWCLLCLLVQGVLWALFISNFAFGLIILPDFRFNSILIVGSLYFMPVLFLNLLMSSFSTDEKLKETTYQINSLKTDERVFNILLQSSQQFVVDDNGASSLLWGDKEAQNRISVVTNPHCVPCSLMHRRLKHLLADTDNGFCVQYIVSSFNEELEESSKLFIAMYQRGSQAEFVSFLDDWYKNGRNNREQFYKKYPFDKNDACLSDEFRKHKKWIDKSTLHATPTILFNGYLLPEQYQLEDLKFF